MKVTITGDIVAESGVDEVIFDLSGPTRKHFGAREYGPGLAGIGIVLMCQEGELQRQLKRRVRFVKKDKHLYLDIMLDLGEMMAAAPAGRRRLVVERMLKEVPEIVAKYRFNDFEEGRFVDDLRSWLDIFA